MKEPSRKWMKRIRSKQKSFWSVFHGSRKKISLLGSRTSKQKMWMDNTECKRQNKFNTHGAFLSRHQITNTPLWRDADDDADDGDGVLCESLVSRSSEARSAAAKIERGEKMSQCGSRMLNMLSVSYLKLAQLEWTHWQSKSIGLSIIVSIQEQLRQYKDTKCIHFSQYTHAQSRHCTPHHIFWSYIWRQLKGTWCQPWVQTCVRVPCLLSEYCHVLSQDTYVPHPCCCPSYEDMRAWYYVLWSQLWIWHYVKRCEVILTERAWLIVAACCVACWPFLFCLIVQKSFSRFSFSKRLVDVVVLMLVSSHTTGMCTSIHWRIHALSSLISQ